MTRHSVGSYGRQAIWRHRCRGHELSFSCTAAYAQAVRLADTGAMPLEGSQPVECGRDGLHPLVKLGIDLSLKVHAYVPDASGMNIIDGPPGRDSAGHEWTRSQLWGSSCVVSLGVRLLSSLAQRDLYVAHDELDVLEADCLLILRNIRVISEATGYGDEYIADRVGNIQGAIARARSANGCVVIW